MKKQIHCVFMLPLLFILAGCSTTGFPRQSYNPARQIQEMEDVFNKPDQIKNFYAMANANEPEKKAARNAIITGRIALIDLNYNQFVSQFSVTKQRLDAGTEVTQLGLNLATTAVGGASAKTVLAAISAGVAGSKLAIDKNFFFEKTVPVLITSMNAQRKVTLAPILEGIEHDTETYPLARALSDVDAYYFAGTFVGALQVIQADAGTKDTHAEVKITQIRDRQFVAKVAQDRVAALLPLIDGLKDAAAIELEKNPPVKDAEVNKLIDLRDKTKQREKNGAVARQMLKMRAVLSGKRSEPELAAWEAAVKSAK
ncbi:MAG: hypothetical protein NT105_00295 [Verrucomicrobia bacterium]|nr:hypothetical protein [Verrucomicrobiota bacterium]